MALKASLFFGEMLTRKRDGVSQNKRRAGSMLEEMESRFIVAPKSPPIADSARATANPPSERSWHELINLFFMA